MVKSNNIMALRMWRSVNSHLTGFNQYLHLIFGSSPPPPAQPCDIANATATTIFHLLELRQNLSDSSEDTSVPDDNNESAIWELARTLLRECPDISEVAQVLDEQGYSVLLRAVLVEDKDVLQLLITEGCSLNGSKCTLPLHLAAKIGNARLVQWLLDQGAQPHHTAGMCYPAPHIPTMHVPSRFHFLETDIYRCDSNHRTPLMYALEGDKVDVVRVLMDDSSSPASAFPPDFPRQPLHHASAHGALQSMQYLLEVSHGDINKEDKEGVAALLHAAPHGLPAIKILIESEANVHCTSYDQQNALHVVCQSVRHPGQLHPSIKYLLGTGMEHDVNKCDHQGNSPLHCLMLQINRLVTSFTPPGTDSEFSISQTDYDSQLLDAMQELLRYNADGNIVNDAGVTSVHRLLLLHDMLLCNDPVGLALESATPREHYKVDFNVLCQALSTLIQHGADMNVVTKPDGKSPLLLLLGMGLSMTAGRIAGCEAGLRTCLRVLLEGGAKPSLTPQHHSQVLSLLQLLGQRCLRLTNTQHQADFAQFYKHVLGLLLLHGLNPNHCTHKRNTLSSLAEGGSGNILLEVVKLIRVARQPSDLAMIHDWVLALLQGGADPDLEPYPSDPIICHSQSSIFLQPKGSQAVQHYMCELADFRPLLTSPQAQQLLLLFYNSMAHCALYECLNTAKFLARFDPHRAPSGSFLTLVTKLSTQPRSLAQIARVSIYKSLDRRITERVPALPLPTAIKQYLLNFD